MYPLVYVVWEDHSSQNTGWIPMNEAEGLAKTFLVESAGFLVSETDDVLVLSGSVAAMNEDSEDIFAGSVSIIKKNIIKREVLDVADV